MPLSQSRYSDNPEGSLFYASIEWMTNRGITVGYPNGTFGKNRSASRGETIAFLHRYFGSPYAPAIADQYYDMSYGDLFYTAISWGSYAGVTGGYPDGTFRPAANVSRAEFATFLYRLEPRSFNSPRGAEFNDIRTGFYYNSVNWMRCYGISGGYGDGTFKPNQPITRGEMAAMLHRYDTLNSRGSLTGNCTTPAPTPPVNDGELSQAIDLARNYLAYNYFSRAGLIGQLEYEGFNNAVATRAVDSLKVNWNQQAVGAARQYLSFMPFSRSGLINQLEYDGFTNAQATYGVDSLSANWTEQAKLAAQSYLDFYPYSREGLIRALQSDGFSNTQATRGIDILNINWNQVAVRAARMYVEYGYTSRDYVIDLLVYDGFTLYQAQYAADRVGL